MTRFVVTDVARVRAGGGRPGPDRRRWIIRPRDLLVLGFDLTGLRVAPGEDGRPARLVKDGTGQAYLTVWFPPQHITERAYYTTKNPDGTKVEIPVEIPDTGHVPKLVDPDATSADEDPDPPPIDAIVAGWSRLVFRVLDENLPIDWTLEGVLEAVRSLELNVPANALPPKKPSSRLVDVITAGVSDATLLLGDAGAASATAQIHAIARSRRKARTLANTLGLSSQTGSVTRQVVGALGNQLLNPEISPILRRPEPAPPTVTQTAIELPYHLVLSPNRFGAWFHENGPATSEETGHTELWHTRLGVRREDGTLIDGDDPLRTVRAVWALDSRRPLNPPLGIPDHNSSDPWRMSLDAFDRHNVMHLSSNFRLSDGNNENRWYEPNPLDVGHFALSSLGAWLDSRGS